jgi:predicted DsbA family dithiol-disulfide isomerase
MLKRFLPVVLIALLTLTAGLVYGQDAEEDMFSEVPTIRADGGAFILGDPDAPVTVIEFADFLCPFCQVYHEDINMFIEDYVLTGQAKFEYRFFPVVDQTLSPLMAQINECAFEQDAFWRTHDVLYQLAADDAVDENIVETTAEAAGLDLETLESCVNGDGPFQYEEDILFGQDLGVSGTPAIRLQVGDGLPGFVSYEGTLYDRGAVETSVLGEIVESDDLESFVEVPNQVLDDELLVDDSLINPEEGCEAPCWRGITPGETTFEDAVDILSEQDDIAQLETQAEQNIEVAIFATAEDAPLCCQLLAEDDGIVSFLQLRTAPDVSLGELVEAIGEPAYVEGTPVTRSQLVFNLYYPESLVLVVVFAPGADAALNDDSEIVGTVFVEPGLFSQVVESTDLYEWAGYLSLNEYSEMDFADTSAEEGDE